MYELEYFPLYMYTVAYGMTMALRPQKNMTSFNDQEALLETCSK